MKKIMKHLAVLGAASLLLGFLVSEVEKKQEKKNRRIENREKEEHRPYGPYEAYVKRPLDFALALIALLFLAPVYLAVAVLVRVKLGKPVLFKQERPGKDGKIFKLYKFRTMTDARDEKGELLPDEVRLTAFGKWLRSTSLDELPELFNILRGEMSLVGPRPLLIRYLPYYKDEEKHRHDIRPGLTGNAQSHGRNTISWESKFNLDIEYVNHVSFLMDIKIIIDTVKAILFKDGVELNALEDFDEYRKHQQNTNI